MEYHYKVLMIEGLPSWDYVVSGAARMTPFTSLWSIFHGQVQVPWFSGAMSLFLCGVAAFLVCDYLEVKREWMVAIISGIMTVSPTFILGNMYGKGNFTFTCAMVLASLSPWLFAKKKPIYYVLSVLALVLSVGTYVSYVSWAISVFIVRQIKSIIIDNEICLKGLWKDNLKYALIVACSIGVVVGFSLVLLNINGLGAQGRVQSIVNDSAEAWEGSGLSKGQWAWNSFKTMILEYCPPFISSHFSHEWGYFSLFDNNASLAVIFWGAWITTIIAIYKIHW